MDIRGMKWHFPGTWLKKKNRCIGWISSGAHWEGLKEKNSRCFCAINKCKRLKWIQLILTITMDILLDETCWFPGMFNKAPLLIFKCYCVFWVFWILLFFSSLFITNTDWAPVLHFHLSVVFIHDLQPALMSLKGEQRWITAFTCHTMAQIIGYWLVNMCCCLLESEIFLVISHWILISLKRV